MLKNIILSFFIFTFLNLNAQTSNDILSNKEVDSLILGYCKVLNETYFKKSSSKEITSILHEKLKSGEFYNTPNLPSKLTSLMRDITQDIHFYVGVNSPRIHSGQAPGKEKKNGGISDVRLIDRTIGYIKLTEFIADDEALQKVIAALQLVKGCESIIFDVSECPGGDGNMGAFINHHLFEKKDYQYLLRKRCSGETAWHQSEVPYNYSNGPKFFNTPVYVLTSKKTGSAAEYFALILKEMKRGTIVGTTTAGAGNPVTMVTFGNYFAYIPICEIITINGTSIEGKGVTPDIEIVPLNLLQETVKIIEENQKENA